MSDRFVKLLIMLDAVVQHKTTWNPEIKEFGRIGSVLFQPLVSGGSAVIRFASKL
jgi:hypothetical protein